MLISGLYINHLINFHLVRKRVEKSRIRYEESGLETSTVTAHIEGRIKSKTSNLLNEFGCIDGRK